MKIVILAGGTGSIALQTGLYQALDSIIDGVETKVIVNAYDNGLSTGAVRKVCDGRILGPSDVRKNQTTRLKLENPDSKWNGFLDIRFTAESSAAQSFCRSAVVELFKQDQKSPAIQTSKQAEDLATKRALLLEAIDTYFASPNAINTDYNDFSLANIIYAGFAKANGNSLRAAAKIMASMMGIQDNVILNDDTSLFLGAVTASGVRVTDESDIVSWGSLDDPFVDVTFTDVAGNEKLPVLCSEAREAIVAANMIIMSSGTQWSSLIPTYASIGFKEAIAESKAKILMVMNRQPDKDSPGQTAGDIVEAIVPRFFPVGRVSMIRDTTGHPSMGKFTDSQWELLANVYSYDPGASFGGKPTHHAPNALAAAVGATYFKEYLASDHFMFDYDDTLVGRGNTLPKASAENRRLLTEMVMLWSKDVSVCTGNSIRAISLHAKTDVRYRPDRQRDLAAELVVYADGGVNKYLYPVIVEGNDDAAKARHVGCTQPNAVMPATYAALANALKEAGIPMSKIENRGNTVLSIRPIDPEYRDIVLSLVKKVVSDLGHGLQATATGRTTIDIAHPMLAKALTARTVVEELPNANGTLTFVGDEFENGNDAPVKFMDHPRVRCLHVSSPAETAFFLTTLTNYKP